MFYRMYTYILLLSLLLLIFTFLFYRFKINIYNFINLQTSLYLISIIILSLNIPVTATNYCSLVGLYTDFFFFTVLDFNFDTVSFFFTFITLIIGFFAVQYTLIYLTQDPYIFRFILFLQLFILSMLFFVLTNNIFILFLTWELLGVSSFFLIGHYSNRVYTFKSATKAFVYNRISDLFFFIFLVGFLISQQTTQLVELGVNFNHVLPWWAVLSLILTSFVKSAQIVFFGWLPDSMEAPIPASALIHSATLVSAGVYLLLRCNKHLYYYPFFNEFLAFCGILSAVFFSLFASFQTDVKRLLALSTIANCGFLYFLIGTFQMKLCLVYFSVHGLYKSLSFLLSGNLIIQNNHTQDFRNWSLKNGVVIYNTVLLATSVFFLGGVKFSILSDIKHLGVFFTVKNYYLIYLYNTLLFLYSILSMCYSFRLILVLFYQKEGICKKKYSGDTNGLLNYYWVVCLVLVYKFGTYISNFILYSGFCFLTYQTTYLMYVVPVSLLFRKNSNLVKSYACLFLFFYIKFIKLCSL